MEVKDIALTEGLDLFVKDGDFVISESDQQHVLLILKTFVGAWKQYPLLGVGIDNYIASAGQSQVLKRSMTVHMESDGYKVNEIRLVTPDKYYIDANRIK